MSIVTVSGPGINAGQTVAMGLANALGYRYVGSEELVTIATGYGTPGAEVSRAIGTRPRWLERFGLARDRYVACLKVALLSVAQQGDVVYSGFVGQALFKDFTQVIKIRVVEPVERRASRMAFIERISFKAALQRVHQSDDNRRQRKRQLFGIDGRDASLYDAVLNLGRMDVSSAVSLVAAMTRWPEYQLTADVQKRIRDEALASRVQVALDVQAGVTSIKVSASDGLVRLAGCLTGISSLGSFELVRIAEQIEGVAAVRSEIEVQMADIA